MKFLSDWFIGGWYLAGGGWQTLVASIVDILVVALVIYKLIMLAKRSRAWQILWGLGFFLILGFISDWLQLHTLSFLLVSSLNILPVAIVILFYPELRHALEEIGRVVGWGRSFSSLAQKDVSDIVREVVRAAARMSEQKIGALIVLERETSLDEITATGTPVDAVVTNDLLCTIFHPGSPLHDGAVIIRGNRVVAAGCTLPLSDSVHIGTMIHTRHKAALGVTEESDAAVVVVSEETGTISMSSEGKLHRGMNEDSLTKSLYAVFGVTDRPRRSTFAKTVDGTLRKARIRS
ncbi:MAG: diadenylate cyclase CdaA [Armatimonadota bacterium]|nr:diadenylate cyclase CdaA [Armatimonadota bacterium]